MASTTAWFRSLVSMLRHTSTEAAPDQNSAKRISLLAVIATILAATCAHQSVAEERVVVVTTGGAYEKALREAWYDPFTKKTGITVVAVAATGAETRTQAKAMVETGNVSWDIYFEGEIQAASPDHSQITEDLAPFCRKFAGQKDLPANACTSAGMLVAYGVTLMAYNTATLGGHAPKSWADMWNIEGFPGGRSFPSFNDPWRVLAAALLADGVPRDKLFPLDVDRAFKKLDQIRPAVTLWWQTGDQSTQGFRNKDYSIGEIWLTRAKSLKSEGVPIAWSYDGAFLVGDRASLIKGAPDHDNALKLLDFYLSSPEVQAKLCESMTCTPPSRDAIAKMSPEAQQTMPGSAEVMRQLIVPDAAWINANQAGLVARWNSWIQ